MKNEMLLADRDEFLTELRIRFEENMIRHEGIAWADVKSKLDANPDKLMSLSQMDATGGEPDVVGLDESTGEYIFYDCSPESPKGRRSLCYDREAWESRKANKPASSAALKAAEMGIEILTEEEYLKLQELGDFDLKTSSWLKTPLDIRSLGGAIFGDKRFGRVFTYHNGAESYYGGRAFRASLRV